MRPTRSVALACALTLAACGSSATTPTSPETQPTSLVSTSFGKFSYGLAPGQTRQLTVDANFSDGTTRSVSTESNWISLTPDVMTITPAGLATAVRPGAANVYVQYQSAALSFTVTVYPIERVAIALGAASPSLPVGKSVALSARYHLSNGLDAGDATQEAVWAVSDPAIATVGARAQITSLQEGRTTVSATFRGVTGTAELWVTPAGCTFATSPTSLRPDAGFMVSYASLGVSVTTSPGCGWAATSNSSDWEIRSAPFGAIVAGGVGSGSIHLVCKASANDCRSRITSFEIAGTRVTKFSAQ